MQVEVRQQHIGRVIAFLLYKQSRCPDGMQATSVEY
jgi:hypothetical protein